ncbi:MAG TPA: DUF502 domain-containing protein [Pirellulaceae bacterium]|nr:DUF502 domain-containing protein [Pirellulaceae bacterium]HMO92797.1 DUF502 domain-containing protein [Pirellulaceae bacterium]HMP69379.1 DUF502 domain-containing protein [Pirellulaceae bacterium]
MWNIIRRHFLKCMVAGFVALLPLIGVVAFVAYLETYIANSWLKESGFYFFGMGIIAAALIIYFVGLMTTTIAGRWLWRIFDRLMDKLPFLGALYQTLKQVMGYGQGPNAFFRRVVFVRSGHNQHEELGLVTRDVMQDDCEQLLTVFVPSVPNPTSGRMIYVKAEHTRRTDLPVGEAMKLLVTIGTGFGDESLAS